LEAAEAALENALKHGVVALKSALAYQRSLRYERTTKHEAEREFNELFSVKHRGNYMPQVFSLGEHFQNYMMHFILGLANKKNLTVQFHTGLQEGYGNILSNSEPSLLANLFLEYPDVDFDLFHMGYPYQHVVSAHAKNFQNVYIDMCWAHIISPEASVHALSEWLDSVPVNKISAFGGDYIFIDGVYGHQYMARRNACRTMTDKVHAQVFDIERAKEICKMLFYDNPLKIFKLEGRI
jgi:predicted TIM-barrel fold metal-dependent hydrolase